jgi:hypothetical protein
MPDPLVNVNRLPCYTSLFVRDKHASLLWHNIEKSFIKLQKNVMFLAF